VAVCLLDEACAAVSDCLRDAFCLGLALAGGERVSARSVLGLGLFYLGYELLPELLLLLQQLLDQPSKGAAYLGGDAALTD